MSITVKILCNSLILAFKQTWFLKLSLSLSLPQTVWLSTFRPAQLPPAGEVEAAAPVARCRLRAVQGFVSVTLQLCLGCQSPAEPDAPVFGDVYVCVCV